MNPSLKSAPLSPSVLHQLAQQHQQRCAGRACRMDCRCTEPGDRLGMAIAHEVNQPLAAIALHAAAARKWLSRAEPDLERALEALALIGAASRQAGDIVRGMQRQAAGHPPDTASVAVDAAVLETLQSLNWFLRKQGVAVETALGLGGACIAANRVQLQQVVRNLVVNAFEALHAGGRTHAARIRVETLGRGDEIEIAVTDNGPGIAPARQARVLASLAGGADNAGEQGSGLGLSISAAIVRAHGGRLWHEPGAPRGACFRLRLPAHAPAHATPASTNAYTT